MRPIVLIITAVLTLNWKSDHEIMFHASSGEGAADSKAALQNMQNNIHVW